MNDFLDRVVLVTGAGRGMGRAVAEAFAAKGAIVAANDITPVNLDLTLERIQAIGGRARDYVFDVAKQMPVQCMVDQVLTDWGRIDVLVNHANVRPRAPLLDIDEWDWRRAIDVNLSGAFFTIQQVGRAMREQGGGVVVNMGTAQGQVHGLKDCAAYVSSKMGLIGLTREAARELAKYNIRVNAVCPGWLEIGQNGSTLQPSSLLSPNPELAETLPDAKQMEDLLPGRLSRPQEIVQVVLFLCSDAASFITGQVMGFH